MKKKVIILCILLFIVILLIGGYFMFFKKEEKDTIKVGNKVLVVFYSASGSTKRVSEVIKNNLNADIFEIIPEDIYTSSDLNYNDENSRVYKEYKDTSKRDVKLKEYSLDLSKYDTILIGYPIWWGVSAWPVNTFVKDNDFTGKTIIPFCTSASSSLGESAKLLEGISNGGNWQEGKRFSSYVNEEDIKAWTDSIK